MTVNIEKMRIDLLDRQEKLDRDTQRWFRQYVLQVAATVNVAAAPAATLASSGCCVIVSTGRAAVTVSTASRLVTEPAALLTTTWNAAPLSPGALGDSV